MEPIFDENGVLEYVKTDIAKPQQSNAQKIAQWKKDVVKVRIIILEGVRNHVVSNIHGKETPFSMLKTLTKLFKNYNDHRKLVLKDKLRNIGMLKNDTIP